MQRTGDWKWQAGGSGKKREAGKKNRMALASHPIQYKRVSITVQQVVYQQTVY
jgi:hypothetical protein